MNQQVVHRHPAGTKAARQIMSQTARILQPMREWMKSSAVDAERAAWNAQVDARRAEKARLKKESKHATP